MAQEDNKMNISLIIRALKENDIRHIVISPGGTNRPFVEAIQDDSFFKCYSVVDERSAIYFAIGLYLQTGEIIATSCTSAQATRNYIPGLTEAYYKNVPVLAITMEKHPRFKYQGYMQAPDQTSLPVDCVKKSYELPFISDENDILHSCRVINEAILELTRDGCGPVQLSYPWLDYALDKTPVPIKSIKRYDAFSEWDDVELIGKKILLVIGEHRPFTEVETKSIDKFCDSYNVAVYTNHLANYHGKYSFNGNLLFNIMRNQTFKTLYAPDIIISIGGQTGDYPLYRKLSRTSLQGTEHWIIEESGKVIDTYDKLTKIFQCSDVYFMQKMSLDTVSSHEYFEQWKAVLSSLRDDIEVPFSSLYAAERLHSLIPAHSYINFSILSSLEIWNFFDLDSTIKCFSNVSAFGIDGDLSTLIGESMETEQLCFMIIGDLAFYYDMNVLSNRHVKNNVRILLINNNGGLTFKMKEGDDYKSINRYTAAADHFKNAKGWAETCGFHYVSVRSKEEFKHIEDEFVSQSENPILAELFVTDEDDAGAIRKFREDNFQCANFSQTDKIIRKTKKAMDKILK